MPAESVQCCVTSPPYWGLRDYELEPSDWPSVDYRLPGGTVAVPPMRCCFGLEDTPEQFIGHAVLVFAEVRRVLRADGTCWVNIGDSYWSAKGTPGGEQAWRDGSNADEKNPARRFGKRPQDGPPPEGIKPKDLVGIPWMLAFALRADGWYLRRDIIWAKPNSMPESVTDRPTSSHEYLFLLTKSARYFYDAEAIREPATFAGPNGPQKSPYAQALGRNKRSVWPIATKPFAAAHFATFPPDLVEPCILAGSPEKACSDCGAPWVAGDGERMLDLSRPQARRAQELADAACLTPAHIDAIRSCGVSDAGKAQITQTGFGKNDEDVQALADEAKEALGGYYREFLLARPSRGASAPTCECEAEATAAMVLDPFAGAATTGLVATRHNRDFIGIELNEEYVELGRDRIRNDAPLLNEPAEQIAFEPDQLALAHASQGGASTQMSVDDVISDIEREAR